MPYIVTTSAPTYLEGLGIEQVALARRAVATLEEARSHAAGAMWEVHRTAEEQPGRLYRALAYSPSLAQIDELPESGGTIGPLPDGTVIEVRRVLWEDVTNESGLNGWEPSARPDDWEGEIIDAFNARHSDRGFARGWLLTRLTLLLVTGLAGAVILLAAVHA